MKDLEIATKLLKQLKGIDTLSTIQYNKRRAIRELIRHTPELTIAPMLIA